MKSYLVTGANKGIGREIVRQILTDIPNSFVFLCSRDEQRGEQAINVLTKDHTQFRERIKLVKLEVTDEQSIQKAFQDVQWELDNKGNLEKQLEALVNNAGSVFPDMKKSIDLNVKAVKNMIDIFHSLMKKGARVVNMSSGLGCHFVSTCSKDYIDFFKRKNASFEEIEAFINKLEDDENEELFKQMGVKKENNALFFYSVSKAVMNLMTPTLQKKYPHLKINSCEPGWVYTDLAASCYEPDEQKAYAMGMKTVDQGARSTMMLLRTEKEYHGLHFAEDGSQREVDIFVEPGNDSSENKL